jgi:hypothetical protein
MKDVIPQQKLSASVSCGKRSLWLGVEVNAREIRVRSSVSPSSSALWSATVLQDRRIVWKGTVKKGELDRRLTNLAGSEAIAVRMSDGHGWLCSAGVTTRA